MGKLNLEEKDYFVVFNIKKKSSAILRSKKQVTELLKISLFTLNKVMNEGEGVFEDYLITIPKIVKLKKDSGGKRLS